MSYQSALLNANTVVRTSVTTTPTQVGVTTIQATVTGWPCYAKIDRIVITSNNSVSGTITVSALSDGASWRAASTAAAKAPYVVDTGTGTMTNNVATVAMSDVYVQDSTGLGLLYLAISATSFTAGTVLAITVYGLPEQTNLSGGNEIGPFVLDNTFRVLLVPASGPTLDLTDQARRALCPWGYNSINLSPVFAALTATTDWLYIGSANNTTHAFAIWLRQSQQQTTAATFQYWNGTAWTTATVLDNTSDGQTAPASFAYSGVLTIPAPSDWAAQAITTDPLYLAQQEVEGGVSTAVLAVPSVVYGQPPTYQTITQGQTISAGAFITNPDRYWMRIQMPSLTDPLNLVGLQIIE